MKTILLLLALMHYGVAMTHPGVLNSKADLDFIKAKIAQSQDPWLTAFNKTNTDSRGLLTYTAHPWATVDCGSGSNPDSGCSDERNDAIAAYTHALLWYFTGNDAHAKKSIEIMNAWSAKLQGGHVNSNARLQAGWTGAVWPRAAEIIRYAYGGWATSDINAFKTMLSSQYVPSVENGSPCENGNWDASDIEALMSISVFLDDSAQFNDAVAMWRKRTPAYFYLSTDGPLPVPPPNCSKSNAALITYWHGQSTFMDGLAQETCRDFGHTGFGFAALINAAETARLQGVDLYGEEKTRITTTMEFHCGYQNGMAVPSDLCGGTLNLGTGGTWEIAYNHYHNRLGIDLPQTLKLIQKQRPTSANYHIDWETLTHAELGNTESAVAGGNISNHNAPQIISLTPRLIRLSLPDAESIEIGVYSLAGIRVARIVSHVQTAGVQAFSLEGEPLSQRFYLVRVKSDQTAFTAKCFLSTKD